jgi:serine protease inhibitor
VDTSEAHAVPGTPFGFVLDLHRLVGAQAAGSYAWSPFSIASALGLVAEGGAGELADTIAALLHPARPGGRPADGAAGWRDVLARAADVRPIDYAKPDDVGFAVANRLWIRDDLLVQPAYQRALHAWPGVRVGKAPFGTDPRGTARAINDDVAEVTRGLIPRLVEPGQFTAQDVAALVNAVWLKAAWATAFKPRETVEQTFHGERGDTRVPMMNHSGRYRYAHVEGWRLVGLPTRAAGMVVDLLLPDADLATAERDLTPDRLGGLLASASPTQLWLGLPKLTLDTRLDLLGPLTSAGLGQLFDAGGSGITGIVDGRALSVGRAVHACTLRVAEAGIEAAAATAMMVAMAALRRPPERLVIDRPFLLLVRHRDADTVFFMARIGDVSAS